MRILSTIIFIIMSLVNLNAQIEEVEDLFSDYRAGESPGASVLVAMNGKIVFVKTYGYANLEEKIFVETKTNFRLASVTKQFTAAAVLILVQRELLNLETKLTDIFTDFPAYGNKITIKHLLTHTSGLIDYEDLIPDTATIQVKDAGVLKFMLNQHGTYFEPGTQYKYSNTGYALLAMIIEKISGQKYSQFLKENIFKPLQMNNT